jgi:MFS family permease
VYITAQIYLEQRVDVAWRARAQSLMTLMTTGVGNLIGYLGTGWWFDRCTGNSATRWPTFWTGLAVAVAAVLIYFLTAYRGRADASLQAISEVRTEK